MLTLDGGAGGIRTLDRALQPYNGLANRRLQPLGHVSAYNHRQTCLRSKYAEVCPSKDFMARPPRQDAMPASANQIRGHFPDRLHLSLRRGAFETHSIGKSVASANSNSICFDWWLSSAAQAASMEVLSPNGFASPLAASQGAYIV